MSRRAMFLVESRLPRTVQPGHFVWTEYPWDGWRPVDHIEIHEQDVVLVLRNGKYESDNLTRRFAHDETIRVLLPVEEENGSMSDTKPPIEFIPPTPSQLLLQRILGGIQALTQAACELREEIKHIGIERGSQESAVCQSTIIKCALEALQDEILQLDSGQIPESIREAYEALQAHGKSSE